MYLYGSGFENRKGSGGGQTTKVRIAFCRERDDRDRTAKLEDDWECQVVRSDGAFGLGDFAHAHVVLVSELRTSYGMP